MEYKTTLSKVILWEEETKSKRKKKKTKNIKRKNVREKTKKKSTFHNQRVGGIEREIKELGDFPTPKSILNKELH